MLLQRFAGLCLTIFVSVLPTAAQTVALGGPSPWIDPTAASWGARCDGMTDDTVAIQNALNAVLSTGSALFIPPTTSGCLVKGYSTQISGASAGSCLGNFCTVTILLASSQGFVNGGLVNIHNVSLGTTDGTIFNGTYLITSVGTCGISPCLTYAVPGTFSGTDTGLIDSLSTAEIGLYFTGSNLKVFGAAEPALSAAGGSTLITRQAITILTTMPSGSPRNGPDIQNVTFQDNGSSAFAGLNIGNSNGFSVSNNGFVSFYPATTSAAAADPQGGAGIVATAGQPTSSVSTVAHL